jgi:5-methylthioadenosine/S-adenosylhomocysteine deaminase
MTEKVDLIVKDGTILTFDENDNIYFNGSVAIKDGKIVDLGESLNLAGIYEADDTIDAEGDLIMPGLINAHTHAAMSVLRGYSDDLPLEKWLDRVFPAEHKLMSDDMVYWGSLVSCAEMIRAGITCTCDGYFFEGSAIRALESAGMRGICAQGVADFPMPEWENPEDKFSVVSEFLKKSSARGDDKIVSPALFVHAPYTASPDTYKKAKELCEEHEVRLFTHIAETEKEVSDIEKKYGKTPVRHLEHEGILNDNLTCVHAVWVDDEEIEILSNYGTSVVHCPGSNAKLASGTAPIPALLKAGVPVGLGTDGPASNNRQDMFFEMDFAAKEQKLVSKDPTALKAKTVLAMALYLGAEAIGLEDEIGSLKKGMAADIIVVDLTRPHASPLFDYTSHLVYSARGSDVKTTIINGRIVYHWGRFLTFDASEATAKVFEIANKLK